MNSFRHCFRCDGNYEKELCRAAEESGLSPNVYIKQVVKDSFSKWSISRGAIQRQSINLMVEVQKIKDEYPEVNTSGLERIGAELCRLSL